MNMQFDTFLARQGEHVVQAILENWERYTGHSHIEPMPLEDRWALFMCETSEPVFVAA